MKNVLIFSLGVVFGILAMLVLSKSNQPLESVSVKSNTISSDIESHTSSLNGSDLVVLEKSEVFSLDLQEKENRIKDLERLLKTQKEDYENRLKGVSFMADSIPLGNNTSDIWSKMDEITKTDYEADKDDWSHRAEQFLNVYLSQNTFIYHANVDYFCDTEACLVTALEFDVGENFHTSDGSKEWIAFWKKTEDDKSVKEFFLKEKMGGSNPGEKERTREKRMIFMRR